MLKLNETKPQNVAWPFKQLLLAWSQSGQIGSGPVRVAFAFWFDFAIVLQYLSHLSICHLVAIVSRGF